MMKRLLCSIIMTVLTAGSVMPVPADAADPDTRMQDDAWIRYVEQSAELEKVPGLTVAAVKGAETGYKSWGYTDLKKQTPMTEDTPVHIGSCSKAFTALAVLLLQEEGKLSAEDSVSDHLPWWRVTYQGKDADIKIRQLLNHSSGLPYITTGYPKDADAETIARLAKDTELASEPGTQFRYIDFGYCVLSLLVETVSGMRYDEYVVKEIMQPIGMTHSGFDLPVIQGHTYFGGRLRAHDDIQPKGNEGAALVCTTPSDMVLWMKAQLSQLELPEKLANAIAASHESDPARHPEGTPDRDYCSGWHQSSDGILWHGGQNPNFTARVIIDPVHDTAVFTVCNAAADTSYYAARSCYMNLLGFPADSFPDIARGMMCRYDLYASVISAVISVFLLIAVILLLTQKKRLAKKSSTPKREKAVLISRMMLLLPLLCFSAAFPRILGAAKGYPGFGYTGFRVWGLYSEIAACLLSDGLIVCLITASVMRYIRQRNAA